MSFSARNRFSILDCFVYVLSLWRHLWNCAIALVSVQLYVLGHKDSTQISPGTPTAPQGLLIGHRGCRNVVSNETGQEIPEHSLEAFEHAIVSGAHGIELDARLTLDSQLVVHHDDYIENDQGATRLISEMTHSHLTRFMDASEIDVHRLEAVLKFVKERKVFLFLELKEWTNPQGAGKRVVELLAKHRLFDQTIVVSFSVRNLLFARYYQQKLFPTSRLMIGILWGQNRYSGWYWNHVQNISNWFRVVLPIADMLSSWFSWYFGAMVVDATVFGFRHHYVSDHLVEKCRYHGLEVMVWGVESLAKVNWLMNELLVTCVCDNPGYVSV